MPSISTAETSASPQWNRDRYLCLETTETIVRTVALGARFRSANFGEGRNFYGSRGVTMVFYGIALAPGSARRIDRGGDAPSRVSSSTRAAQGTCKPMIANRPVFDFKMAAVSSARLQVV